MEGASFCHLLQKALKSMQRFQNLLFNTKLGFSITAGENGVVEFETGVQNSDKTYDEAERQEILASDDPNQFNATRLIDEATGLPLLRYFKESQPNLHVNSAFVRSCLWSLVIIFVAIYTYMVFLGTSILATFCIEPLVSDRPNALPDHFAQMLAGCRTVGFTTEVIARLLLNLCTTSHHDSVRTVVPMAMVGNMIIGLVSSLALGVNPSLASLSAAIYGVADIMIRLLWRRVFARRWQEGVLWQELTLLHVAVLSFMVGGGEIAAKVVNVPIGSGALFGLTMNGSLVGSVLQKAIETNS